MKKNYSKILEFRGSEASEQNIIELAHLLKRANTEKIVKKLKLNILYAQPKNKTKAMMFKTHENIILVLSENIDNITKKLIFSYAILSYIFEINNYPMDSYTRVFDNNYQKDPLIILFEQKYLI